ncbi:protein of unknown function [Taphrina deformans PYCC 5710]|uniref:Uncharacterized protein n=1 Tax=Taphrina deformans (strain PYCC 5710 / ATCC 11124 / CBS 356.35 / IMI 108563 / JCM 9778 / NBRC 8474) TaxID=1097556 RepID=R4XEM1_TAPDE|nr:protein of unknown function [Taphrina deformans PYCC 5710]|eukprot:CCG84221.1 protein of unknown function [Taphrina deformans PYCC 5710]
MQFSALIAASILSFVAGSPIAAPAPQATSYDLSGIDWKTVNYNVDWKTVDYSNVDWNTIDWNSVFGNKPAAATPTPAAGAPAAATTPTAAAATATASAASDSSFTLVSIHSGSDLQYQPVHASNQKLQIGGDPSNSISPGGVPVPVTNITSFHSGQDGLALNVASPGGQQVFVNADGILGFTTAHSGSVPVGATLKGFAVSDNDLTFNGKQQFVACPVGATGVYDLGVEEKVTQTGCTGVALRATNGNTAAAWQW